MTRVRLTLLVGLLAGCQLGAEVRVVGDGPRPGFVVTQGGDPACIQGLTISEQSSGPRRNVWAIRRVNRTTDASCTGRVTFGVVPPGYEVAVAGGRLGAGRAYEVNTSGVGWHAKAPFTVR